MKDNQRKAMFASLSAGQQKRIESMKKSFKEVSPGDDTEARELQSYAENDYGLYRQQGKPIQENLERKYKKDMYNSDGALLAWRNFADTSAKKYERENPGVKFNTRTRNVTAKLMRDDYEDELRSFDKAIERASRERR